MNGLETIINRIQADAKSQADIIIAQAQKQADEIMAKANQDADVQCKKIIQNAHDEAAQIASNRASACEAVKNKTLLKAKTQIINNWLEMSKQHFSELDDATYFEYIKKLVLEKIEQYPNKCGKLILNEMDNKRLPENFINDINSIAKNGCTIELGLEKANIVYGFLLEFGDIYENCSFDALIDEKKDEICDSLFKLLNA